MIKPVLEFTININSKLIGINTKLIVQTIHLKIVKEVVTRELWLRNSHQLNVVRRQEERALPVVHPESYISMTYIPGA